MIRSFVKSRDYQFLIGLTTAASKMPQCDWGLVRVVRLNVPFAVLGQMRVLTHFLIVQAKVSACDGQYKAALENALTMRESVVISAMRIATRRGIPGEWMPAPSI